MANYLNQARFTFAMLKHPTQKTPKKVVNEGERLLACYLNLQKLKLNFVGKQGEHKSC